jgi:hypothetical protein
MIDDRLIQQLKTYITEHYQLAGEPASEELQELSAGRTMLSKMHGLEPAGKPFGNAARNIRPPVPSFKELTDTLAKFISKERKSETFSAMLERLRKEKGVTAAQLYNGAWIKKQLYSKIMGERNYHPSKNTVIAFGLSLRLDRDGMDELLESAGYLLSNSSIADLVICFCLDQGLNNLRDANALLLSVDQKVLCRE